MLDQLGDFQEEQRQMGKECDQAFERADKTAKSMIWVFVLGLLLSFVALGGVCYMVWKVANLFV